MNFLNKMERKIGKYAIPNLMIYLIAAYCIGFVIYTVNPNFMLMLTLSPYHILHGQVWRLITWILMPTDTRVFSLLIMALLYYQLGSALERSWGTFRFNVYIFGGMLFTVIGAFILYKSEKFSWNRKLRNNFIDFKPYFHYELYQSDHIPCLCGHVSGNADFTVLYYSGKNEVDGSGICSTDCD